MTRRGGVGIVLVAAVAALGAWRLLRPADLPATVAPAPLPVDRDTTRLTGPLDAQGRVDYAAALNAGRAVPPDENAAIPLLRMFGTEALVGDRELVLARLGAPADPTARGVYVPRPDEPPFFDESWDEGVPEDLEPFRAWLEHNGAAIELLLEASRRSHLWWPIARNPAEGLLQPALDYGRWIEVTRLLRLRADVRLFEGEVRAAWEDVRAELRLARLMEAPPMLLPRLLGMAQRNHPFDWVARALGRGALDDATCAEIAQTLLALPPARGLDREVVEQERLLLLDAYVHRAAGAIRAEGGDPVLHPANVALAAALREINRRFDGVAALLPEAPATDAVPGVSSGGLPDARATLAALEAKREAARKEVEALNEDLRSLAGRAEHALEQLSSRGAHAGRVVGLVLSTMVVNVLPTVHERALRMGEQRDLVALALALRRHQLRTGAFPATLADLVPDTIAVLPDVATDLAAVAYERTDEGCLLTWEGEGVEIEIAAQRR